MTDYQRMDNSQYEPLPDKSGYPPVQNYPAPSPVPVPQSYQTAPGYPAQPPPATQVTMTQPTTQVVVVGNCPVCHAGIMTDQYTTCGIILAIIFFPIGILCCLVMKERVCSNCGAHFG